MIKQKTHKLVLKKRTNRTLWFTPEGEAFFPTTLTFGLPKDKKADALKLILKVGQKNEPLPKGDVFEIKLTLKRIKTKVEK